MAAARWFRLLALTLLLSPALSNEDPLGSSGVQVQRGLKALLERNAAISSSKVHSASTNKRAKAKVVGCKWFFESSCWDFAIKGFNDMWNWAASDSTWDWAKYFNLASYGSWTTNIADTKWWNTNLVQPITYGWGYVQDYWNKADCLVQKEVEEKQCVSCMKDGCNQATQRNSSTEICSSVEALSVTCLMVNNGTVATLMAQGCCFSDSGTKSDGDLPCYKEDDPANSVNYGEDECKKLQNTDVYKYVKDKCDRCSGYRSMIRQCKTTLSDKDTTDAISNLCQYCVETCNMWDSNCKEGCSAWKKLQNY